MADWERVARRILDTEQIGLVVSGSSARLLSREVHTSLRGRGMATTSGCSTFGNTCSTGTRNL